MSLVSSASVSLVNNKGNVHLVLKELSSKEQMRSLAVAILTANTAPSGPLDQITVGTVLDKAQGIVIDSAYKAGVQTAIMGGKYGDNFKQTVQTAGVNAFAEQVVDAIGQRYHASEEANAIEAAHPNLATENPELAAKLKAVPRMNPLMHLGAHAVTGAGTAALKGESKELGAIGQVVGELGGMTYKKIASENLAPGEALNKETGVNVAKFVAGTTAVLATGGQKDVSIAIDTGGRAAEFNTLSGQEKMEERDQEKRKKAAKLVRKGYISAEEMEVLYDSLSIADMVEIKEDHRRVVPKKVKGYGEGAYDWGVATYKEGKEAQKALKAGDKRPETIAKASFAGAPDLLSAIVPGFGFFFPSQNSNPSMSEDVGQTQVAKPSKSMLYVDPSEPYSYKDEWRDKIKGSASFSLDHAKVLFTNIEKPEDFRNLAPGAENYKIVKDTVGKGLNKASGFLRYHGQNITKFYGGNDRLAVDVGAVATFIPDAVALWLAPEAEAAKIAQGAGAMAHVGRGSSAVADVVSVANKGTKLTDRGASVVSKAQVSAKTAAVTASEKVGQYFGNVPESYKFKSEIFNEPITWAAPNGTQQTYKVFSRSDIDWNHVRTEGPLKYIGKTNLEAAKGGFGPQLPNGNFATLHHLGQNASGPLAEASTKYHGVGKSGQSILHSQFGPRKPHPTNPVDHGKFAQDTKDYWKMKGNDVTN